MTALAANRAVREERWTYKEFTLASGNIAYQGGAAFYNMATNKVVPGQASSTLVYIGTFVDKVDASAADKTVNVHLIEEVVITYFANATAGDAVAATDVMKDCYFLDDQTVTITRAAHVVAGRVWVVDSTKGVGIQKLPTARSTQPIPTLGAFAAGDNAPADIINGAVYNIPATAANSTFTLPAAAVDGTVAYFSADGTNNGHTLQYRDATGPTNLTTALTASKRHLVVATKVNGKWTCNAYVAP